MFGLSMEHLLILLVAALFIIGPERLPDAVRFLTETRGKIRGFASGAQEKLQAELGPEFQELRKPLRDLQALRAFDPRTVLGRFVLEGASAQNVSAGAAPALRPGERPPFDPDAT